MSTTTNQRGAHNGLAALSAATKAITRQNLCHRYHDSGLYRSLSLSAPGYEWHVQTPHRPEPDGSRLPPPGVWYGKETVTDAAGRQWNSCLPHYFVMNDFGFLVEVPA